MADPVVGGYPPEQEAPGAQALRGLAAGGFNQDEVVQYKQKNSSLMLNNGFTQKEVDQYWGDDHPAPPVSATNYANAQMAAVPPDQKPAAATDWWEALNAGLQDTGEGRTLRGLLGINHGEPSTVMPEHVGLGMTIANAIGSGISSLPSWITGATVATPVGAAAGAAVPGAGETAPRINHSTQPFYLDGQAEIGPVPPPGDVREGCEVAITSRRLEV